jgi:hypothetical protein
MLQWNEPTQASGYMNHSPKRHCKNCIQRVPEDSTQDSKTSLILFYNLNCLIKALNNVLNLEASAPRTGVLSCWCVTINPRKSCDVMLYASLSPRMKQPRVADRGDGLQIRKVAANILNKQSRTADKRWSCSLEIRRGANNSSPKKSVGYETTHGAPELDGFFGTTWATENCS